MVCLPKRTLAYQYESMARMEEAVHNTIAAVDDEKGGYCVFVDVPGSIVDDHREALAIGTIAYYTKSRDLNSQGGTRAK